MSEIYLYSTMTNSQSVTIYEKYPGSAGGDNKRGSAKPSVRKSVVHIEGGANLNATGIETPKGVLTIINESQLKELEKQSCFRRWKERGFITVERAYGEEDEVAQDMTEKDNSAQHTVEEHEERFESGETSADVVVDEAPKKKRAPRKARKPAATKEASEEPQQSEE